MKIFVELEGKKTCRSNFKQGARIFTQAEFVLLLNENNPIHLIIEM